MKLESKDLLSFQIEDLERKLIRARYMREQSIDWFGSLKKEEESIQLKIKNYKKLLSWLIAIEKIESEEEFCGKLFG